MGIIKSINDATTRNEPVDARSANDVAAWYAVDAWLANDVAAWYVIDARLANDVAAWYVADASAAASWNGNAVDARSAHDAATWNGTDVTDALVDARLAHDATTRNEADASAAAAWNGNAVDARVAYDATTRNGAYAVNAWVTYGAVADDGWCWHEHGHAIDAPVKIARTAYDAARNESTANDDAAWHALAANDGWNDDAPQAAYLRQVQRSRLQ